MASVVPDHPPLLWDITKSFPIGVLLADGDGQVIDTNRAWSDLSGLSARESEGEGWLRALERGDRGRAARLVVGAARARRCGDGEWALVTSDNGTRMARWRAAPHDHLIDDCRAVVLVDDIEDDRRREAQLVFAATHDPLTQLANRAHFLASVERALARLGRHRVALGVMFVDLDGFKRVNDREGHAFGDRVLAAQARRLRAAIRPSDTAGRVGGDEFAVLCEDLSSRDDMRQIADRVASMLNDPPVIDGHQIDIGASIGVAVATTNGMAPEALLAIADRAMYRAKRTTGAVHVVDKGEPA